MRLRLSIVAIACLVAAACGGHSAVTSYGAHSVGKQAGPALQTPGPNLYIADTANNSVDQFASNDGGDTAPSAVISGPNTQLSSPNGVAVGVDGSIYVANEGGQTITEYAPNSSGDAVPTRTMSCGGLARPAGISLDLAGNLYVANSAGKSISVFGPLDSGCVSGNRIITGIHTCLFSPQDVDVRADGTTYVASSSTVLVFKPGASGDATPIQKITGSNTQLLPRVMGVSLGSLFNIYATSASTHKHGRVTVYAPAATGNVAPLQTISGNLTTLGAVDKIDVDLGDQIFVTNGSAMDVFAAGSSGNVAPFQVLSGPSTTFLSPAGLDIMP